MNSLIRQCIQFVQNFIEQAFRNLTRGKVPIINNKLENARTLAMSDLQLCVRSSFLKGCLLCCSQKVWTLSERLSNCQENLWMLFVKPQNWKPIVSIQEFPTIGDLQHDPYCAPHSYYKAMSGHFMPFGNGWADLEKQILRITSCTNYQLVTGTQNDWHS